MRVELVGNSANPVAASVICTEVIRLAQEIYGPLAGIENAAARIAENLVALVAKETGVYLVIIDLGGDGGYYFGVRAPRYIATRPRCLSWGGPGDYLLEVGCLPSGNPFNKHLELGLL